jgi:hypothetical protein
MAEWPEIAERELLERLAMDDAAFDEYLLALLAALPRRSFERVALERALAYPWERPEGSYLLADGEVRPLEEMSDDERRRTIAPVRSGAANRLPVLAIGSNGAPGALRRKFAHFAEPEDRTVLALTGRLHGFDIGVAPHAAVYGAMPATPFPSPGTRVAATLLWVTPAQFVQLTWSELSYRLGRLRTHFEVDGSEVFDDVLVFVSRFGSFCVDGRPVALAAVPAEDRVAEARTQKQLLDAAAALAIGPEAGAEALVRAIFEELDEITPRIVAGVRPQSVRFESELWTPFEPGAIEAD